MIVLGRAAAACMLLALGSVSPADAGNGFVPDLVADLSLGPAFYHSGRPADLTFVGDAVYFSADTPATGRELFRVDPATLEVARVVDLTPGPRGSDPRILRSAEGGLFFVAYDGAGVAQVWFLPVPGTQPVQLTAFVADGNGYSPDCLFAPVVHQRYYFHCRGATVQGPSNALWSSDGTAAGTIAVREYGSGDGVIAGSLQVDGNVAVFVERIGSVAAFARSDGTIAGTVPLAAIAAAPIALVRSAVSPAHRYCSLWLDAGEFDVRCVHTTLGGASTLYHRSAVEQSSWGELYGPSIATAGNRFVFHFQPEVEPRQVWSGDPATGTATQILIQSPQAQASVTFLVSAGARAAFITQDSSTNALLQRVFVTDGTKAGTLMLARATDGIIPEGMVSRGGTLFYLERPSTTNYPQLVEADSITAAVKYYAVNAQSEGGNLRLDVAATSERVFFGSASEIGVELWTSPRNSPAPKLVVDLWPGTEDSAPAYVFEPTLVGNSIFAQVLIASSSIYPEFPNYRPTMLVRTDGTAGGTRALDSAQIDGFQPYRIARSGGRLLFDTGYDGSGANGSLFGTDESFDDVQQLLPGACGYPQVASLGSGGFMYCGTHSFPDDFGLYTTDGSTAHVERYLRLQDGAFPLGTSGNVLFFTSRVADNYTLWRTDGTSVGTVALTPFYFCFAETWGRLEMGGRLLISGRLNLADQCQLWALEAGMPGLTPLGPSTPFGGGEGTVLSAFAVPTNGRLLLALNGPQFAELWETDGTPAGTRRLHEQLAASPQCPPRIDGAVDTGDVALFTVEACAVMTLMRTRYSDLDTQALDASGTGLGHLYLGVFADGKAFGTGFDEAHGWELWEVSDQPPFALLVDDVFPGPRSAVGFPRYFMTALPHRLLLFAQDPYFGYELHSLILDGLKRDGFE